MSTNISTEQIKELRERTGISIAQCKQALEDAGGDMDKALAFLREKGAEVADKKSNRELKAGVISSYIHNNGTIGALLQIHTETDFVAKNPEFKALADDIVMHLAAMGPDTVEELLTQPFIKDPSLTVSDLIKGFIQKFGERIEVVNFARLSLAD
jgi:elongation factor Ts